MFTKQKVYFVFPLGVTCHSSLYHVRNAATYPQESPGCLASSVCYHTKIKPYLFTSWSVFLAVTLQRLKDFTTHFSCNRSQNYFLPCFPKTGYQSLWKYAKAYICRDCYLWRVLAVQGLVFSTILIFSLSLNNCHSSCFLSPKHPWKVSHRGL